METMVISPVTIFTAATVLVGISFIFLSNSWKTLKGIVTDLPENQRKIIFKYKDLRGKKRVIEQAKGELFIGCVLFGFSIAMNTGAILIIAVIMLGFHQPNFLLDDYNASRYLLLIGTFLFFLAMFCIAVNYAIAAIALRRGRYLTAPPII